MPLTSMEKFHWFGRNREFNNRVFGRLLFRGQIDTESATKAVKFAFARHPLLSARVKRDKNKLTWEWDPRLLDDFAWNKPDKNAINFDDELDQVRGWNICSRSRGDQTHLFFQASHVVCDGLGGIQAINDFLQTYHHYTTQSGSGPRLRSLDCGKLAGRGRLGLTQRSYLKHLWKQPLGLYGTARFIAQQPAELFDSPESLDDWDNQSQPSLHGAWIDVESSKSLRLKSGKMQISVNTLFFGLLMKTLERFRKQQSSASEWIRVLLPMSIRTLSDRRLPAANRSTIVHVDRTPAEIEGEDFYRYLHREINIIRNWELGKLFLLAVRGMSAVPGLLRRSASNPKCRGTAVFANLAEPFRMLNVPIVDADPTGNNPSRELQIGNLHLQQLDFVGPIRYRTPINFTVQKYLERYRISLHSDPRVVPQPAAKEILDAYKVSIDQMANS